MTALEKEAFMHGYKIIVTMAEGMANEARKHGDDGCAGFMDAFVFKAKEALPEFVDMVNADNMGAVLFYVEQACETKGEWKI